MENSNIEKFKKQRLGSMVASMVICIFAGFGYAWSVLQTPIVKNFGWSEMDVSLTFTITIVLSTMTPLFLGGVIKKIKTRQTILLGGIFLGLGLFLTGFMNDSVAMLYITYGILTGIGVGLIYPCIMAYSVKLYPDRQGLSSGLMATAYGSGAVIWAPVAVNIIQKTSLSSAFKILGIVFLFVILVLSLFIKDIPEGFIESFQVMDIVDDSKVRKSSVKDKNRREMIKTAIFYIMIITFTFGTTSGLMVIGQASPILQQSLGFTEAKAALFVGVFSICNTLGRLVWGLISDKVGKYNVMLLLFVISGICMAIIPFLSVKLFIIIAMSITACCYGGFATVITPLTADIFGTKYITENYGLMYIIFGLASLIGPRVAVLCKELDNGSYDKAFLVAFLLSIIGLILAFVVKRYNEKISSNNVINN